MADKDLPTPETLRKLLAYDPETGKLTWLPRPVEMFPSERICNTWNSRLSGKGAFTATGNHGYRIGAIFNRGLLAHRVIWAIVYGEWPDADIDHINGVRIDNRIGNLRSVSHHENGRNQATPKNNTSGAVGVCWDKRRSKWSARIKVDGRDINLGRFSSFDEAVTARLAASVQHGYHPNHGRLVV